MDRHLELVVDKWPIGPQNRVHSRGDRFAIDDKAAHILVGMGKAKYIDRGEPRPMQSRVMANDPETPRHAPKTKRKYNRRDMQASQD